MSATGRRDLGYPLEVVDADPGWPRLYEFLCDRAAAALGRLTVTVEHVGSTSVPGLAAKPVIDLDVVIASRDDLPEAIERLASLGYVHVGDLGIAGREAFRRPDGDPRHNLYVCAADSVELRRHLAFRDYLRAHPDEGAAYVELKRSLAVRHAYDIDAYAEGKSEFVQRILRLADGPA
jgi:GrpB-like predicted nucleotidyltransferase (UPF0157 family)